MANMKVKYSYVEKDFRSTNSKAIVIRNFVNHYREVCTCLIEDAQMIVDALNNDYNELTRERNTAIEDRERWHDMAHEMYTAITQGYQTRLQELAQIYEENMR